MHWDVDRYSGVRQTEAFSTPVQQLIEELRATEDPELADLAQQVEARRRQNQARLMAFLHEQGVLRSGLSLEEATDVLWARKGYDLYRMLVVEQRREPERYETWLAQLLVQHLLASR
jgi:hypothetical protein